MSLYMIHQSYTDPLTGRFLPKERDAIRAQTGLELQEAGTDAEVAESARARSCHSISTGTQIGAPPGSESVLRTLCSVKKCLIHRT